MAYGAKPNQGPITESTQGSTPTSNTQEDIKAVDFMLQTSQPDQKSRRVLHIPEDIANLISLPEGRDYLTFRDTEFYEQFAQESFDSQKWPEVYFGASADDIIKVSVFGNEGQLITKEYITKDDPLFDVQLANGQIMSTSYGTPLVVKFDHGKFLRDLGYRKGQFKISLEFCRLLAGSPFPVLVNNDEKIYIGEFTQGDDSFIYANTDHPESGTQENDKLYVKENKFIITQISSDKSEVIISPNFINDEDYLEKFRKAAYSCLNVFPELGPDGLPVPATFESPTSNFIVIDSDTDLPQSYINGKIRINNAYLMDNRILPELPGNIEVIPEIEIDSRRPNLISGTNLDNRFGWTGHGAWPNQDAVVLQSGNDIKKAVELTSVGESNPVGILATKATIVNLPNTDEGYLNDVNKSASSIIAANLAVLTNPPVKMPEGVDINGTTFTYSVFVKSPAGAVHRLQAHSGPWYAGGQNTATSPYKESKGDWMRLVFTFQMTDDRINDRLQLRILTEFPQISPTSQELLGTSWLMTGAQLEQSTEVSKFTRDKVGGDLTYERPINGSIQFENPSDLDDRVLVADFPDGIRFNEKMVGGTLTINDAIAVVDFSNVSFTNEAEAAPLWNPVLFPADGDYGQPGNLAEALQWDNTLHQRAIRVSNEFGLRAWTDGYLSWAIDKGYSHSGTGGVGYHAMWLADEGPAGEPCMYFPDINYQDYIYEPMKEESLALVTDPEKSKYLKNNVADPRFDNAVFDQENWKHRDMKISSLHADSETGGLSPLGSYGVKAGDTLRFTWQQKSRPINFDDGQRKGAHIRFYKYLIEEPPGPPDIEPVVAEEDVQNEMLRIYDIIKQNSNNFNNLRQSLPDGTLVSGSAIDNLEDSVYAAIQNGWVKFDPNGYEKPDWTPEVGVSEVQRPNDPPLPPTRRGGISGNQRDASTWNVGYKVGGDNDPWQVAQGNNGAQFASPPNDEAPAPQNYWSLDPEVYSELQEQGFEWVPNGDSPFEEGQWRWIDPSDTSGVVQGPIVAPIELIVNEDNPDVQSGQISPSPVTTAAFGWVYFNNRWMPNHVKAYATLGQENFDRRTYFLKYKVSQDLITTNIGEVYPAHDTLSDGLEKYSPDNNYVWGAYGWEIASEEANEPQYRWTHSNVVPYQSPYASITTAASEYDEWEQESLDVVVGENWALDQKCQLQIHGQYGDYGELWVTNVEMQVLRTNDEKVNYVKDAQYAPLQLQIEEVISPSKIKVTEDYKTAEAAQGGVTSNLAISEYSTFDSGFSVDFVEEPESERQVYARYEGKILDVHNHDGVRKLVVDKSYEEYGQQIQAILTGIPSIEEYIPNPQTAFTEYFIRHRIKDADNLYTYLNFNNDEKALITNFKAVNSTEYPGSIAYKLMEPLSDDVKVLDMCYIGYEVTPDVVETVELIPFNDEKIPDTVLRVPFFNDKESPIRIRQVGYKSHTDIVGTGKEVREQLEDRLISGSLETAKINVDFNRWENFVHFGSATERIKNFKNKLTQIEEYTNRSQSLVGTLPATGYLSNSANTAISGAASQIHTWEVSKREVINGFDQFENYMYFQSSSYVTSSNGEFYDNAAPKRAGDGTLTNPYKLHSVTSSQFTTWYDDNIVTASLYDRQNVNRLINLLPEHITYDKDNIEFLRFMDMMGHHYDEVWTHIKALTDVHDRTEDITKGISQALVEPVARSLGFKLKEGKDLVKLPQYHLGLAESGSNTGVFNVRFTKKSQKDVTREIWNRLLASSPYLLKSKGTKQSFKGVLAAYGIPTSILRIQEYGGPRITGAPDFEIKQRFTKAVDFQGGEYIEAPWYNTGTGRVPDTIEFRFKLKKEEDVFLASKHKSGGDLEAAIFVKNTEGVDGKGELRFMLADYGAGANQISMSLGPQPFYNGEYWSVMLRRRASGSLMTSGYQSMIPSSNTAATQSFDLFAGYYDSGIDEIIVKTSGSFTVSSSLVENYYATSSGTDNRWFIGGKTDNPNSTGINTISGSIMEWRYWNTPLSESAFYNHVSAPKAVNGNHVSSSYYDMDLRFSMDDDINLNSLPNGIKDYSLTGGQLYATASGFPDRLNFSNVSDRQKAFLPKIGVNKKSSKIRVENSLLKAPDGTLANLSPTERVEISSHDTAGIDSNKLGVFFAPTDVINEDIMLSLADMDFGSYLGDPRDTYEDRYTHGRFDRVADTYWQKWTTKQGFWDYIKLIKYYDLSLFDILRQMSPGRAKKNFGLLFEPTMLERTKVVVGKKPVFEDVKKKAVFDLDQYSVSSSKDAKEGVVNAYNYEYTASNKDVPVAHFESSLAAPTTSGSQLDRVAHIPEFSYFMSSSNALFRSAITSSTSHIMKSGEDVTKFEHASSSRHLKGINQVLTSTRIDYKTVSGSIGKRQSIKKFGIDYMLDVEDREYTDAKVVRGGHQSSFFSGLEPTYTASKKSEHNQEYVFFYSASNGRTASQNKLFHLPYSSSLKASEFESIYNMTTGLTNLAYAGCKEDGTTAPRGPGGQTKPLAAVEINEVNPYQVSTTGGGDSYLDTELADE